MATKKRGSVKYVSQEQLLKLLDDLNCLMFVNYDGDSRSDMDTITITVFANKSDRRSIPPSLRAGGVVAVKRHWSKALLVAGEDSTD
jgi:hypothetical protein